jgi:hypothetical protein
MCDYSLGGIDSRLAMEGEELIVHRFPTHSIGLASPSDLQSQTGGVHRNQSLWGRIKHFFAVPDQPNVQAICVPPGACLIVKNIPDKLQRKWNVGQEEFVSFLQTGMEAHTYRDAIMFTNGCQVLLQELSEGIPVRVVSLSGDSKLEPEPAVSVPSGPLIA